MIQWQFLIQKEGDQDWLPLESPNVEILEGRYYLMAQSDHQSMPIEIQIRHEYELEGIPQAVTQRRRQQTDSQGLLELFSLTYLPPGLWELQCQVAASEYEDKKAPGQKLVLQVLAQDFEVLSDWAYPEPFFGEDAPIAVDFSKMPVATAYSSTTAIAPAVQLPAIPKETAPLLLRLSDPFCLPPILYRPQNDRDEAMLPQLPDFVLGNPLMPAAMPLAMMELPLHLLHCVTESADRQEVYKAFEPLAQRQRFLSTLNSLAQRS
jgi:hypothetical protein